MSQRDKIEQAIKAANSGGEAQTYSDAVELYGEVCASFYMQMMRQLNMIKTLKNEIELYQNGSTSEEEEAAAAHSGFNSGAGNQNTADHLSCFSCI